MSINIKDLRPGTVFIDNEGDICLRVFGSSTIHCVTLTRQVFQMHNAYANIAVDAKKSLGHKVSTVLGKFEDVYVRKVSDA